jgi:DNA-binding winged helix-turn-helix (wHTH) protein
MADSTTRTQSQQLTTPMPPMRASSPRHAELQTLFQAVREMRCLSVVGVSNTGKSALLRAMTQPDTQHRYLGGAAGEYVFSYIDFNQMLEMSEQAFYELVLRSAMDALRNGNGQAISDGEALKQIQTSYTGVVAPASSFEIPLRFSQAMAAIGDLLAQKVVFLFDELDGPISGIDGRVFLNLRALYDRHRLGLVYITATNCRLAQLHQDQDIAEFSEIFSHHILYVAPLNPAEIADYAARFAANEHVTFSEEDVTFLRVWSGGHPVLLESTARVLGMLTGKPVRDRSEDWIIHRRAADILKQDLNVQTECRKIWQDLTPGEQEALLWLHSENGPETPVGDMDSAVAKGLVVSEGAERQIFSRTFDEFVQRQMVMRKPSREGVQVDLDSGEVWVNGAQIPTLTNLEYRLLLLLYGRMGKICDKYEVVEAVWGEEYLDQVDDARIEKLISRTRQKIEPDAANPRYLLTIRGRGYKLVADG